MQTEGRFASPAQDAPPWSPVLACGFDRYIQDLLFGQFGCFGVIVEPVDRPKLVNLVKDEISRKPAEQLIIQRVARRFV
jgi:hypothetical protein